MAEKTVRVAVIGRTVARELFASDNPLGRPIRIADGRFRIEGVLPGAWKLVALPPSGALVETRVDVVVGDAARVDALAHDVVLAGLHAAVRERAVHRGLAL